MEHRETGIRMEAIENTDGSITARSIAMCRCGESLVERRTRAALHANHIAKVSVPMPEVGDRIVERSVLDRLPPRVSNPRERGNRIVAELKANVKQESDPGRRAMWSAALAVAESALAAYDRESVNA